ncbi:cyclin-D5-1-like [Actinidia eriantha]|uniref:cyclin-D5-1-like n=1 Tax=Actinidia eriantha TaxID=165200 RepID=UPI00258282DD|nr:cyclin-D5-1-like [Actinidia eriantha]
MEDYHSRSTYSPSIQLLCQESETCLDEEGVVADEDASVSINSYSVSEANEDEYVQMLIDRERTESESSRISIDDWIKCARSDAITWILKARALFRFRFQTAYLSVVYFDRFLSKRIIDSDKYWAIRLLSLACLSLAAKMEECRVPALSEFRVEEYNFGSEGIQRMELLVLNTLEWKMSSVTPFAYLHHFIAKLFKDQSPPRNVISRTVQLILAMMRDVNLMHHRPSVVAGAATLVALDRKLTREAMEIEINSFSPSGLLEIEDVFSCYNRMQELDMMEATLIPECSPTDAFENTSTISAFTNKRKRLTFNDCDQDCGISDEKRKR